MPGLKNDSTSMRQVPKECVVAHSHVSLTHICLMDFPFLINLTIPFPILGLLGGIFNFYLKFDRTFCKQAVETLIRHSVLWRVIWVCTDFLCPTKRMLGLCGLREEGLNHPSICTCFTNLKNHVTCISIIVFVCLFVCLFDLILYVPSTIFQLNRDGSSWVEPVLS